MSRRADYRVDEVATRGRERSLTFVVGHWGGAEARPTRLFLWVGERVPGRELVHTLDLEPRLLRSGRRRRHLRLGAIRITYLGNPLVTLGLLVYNALRRRRAGRTGTPQSPR